MRTKIPGLVVRIQEHYRLKIYILFNSYNHFSILRHAFEIVTEIGFDPAVSKDDR
jgi:hypothetical protein